MRILLNNVRAICRCECRYLKSDIRWRSAAITPEVYERVVKTTESKGKVKKKVKDLILSTPKGTRDFGPREMAIRSKVLEKITSVFKLHGAEMIDTPTFELKELLMGDCEEEDKELEEKLIFNISEHNNGTGENYCLRYDLTVPFARYLATNKIKNFKRCQIAKVYRRDEPEMIRARYREFLQCDFDIAGVLDPMVPDSECVRIISEILEAVNIGNFKIKVNHRGLLNGFLEVCGVSGEKFRAICQSIDKLDKESWEDVGEEMIKKKGLHESTVKKIGEFVILKGGVELVEKLKANEELCKSKSAVSGLDSMKLLFCYCDILGVKDRIVLDLSLARGLEYYTGVIFEAVLLDKISDENGETVAVGSVAGGGRYDNLVEKFDPKWKIPCVGVSIGVERIFRILEAKLAKEDVRTTEIDVFVASAHNGLLEEKMKLVRELWDGNIKAEQFHRQKKKFLDQMQYCEERKIPLVIVLGAEEIQNKIVKIRDVETREETEIPRENLIQELKSRLANSKVS